VEGSVPEARTDPALGRKRRVAAALWRPDSTERRARLPRTGRDHRAERTRPSGGKDATIGRKGRDHWSRPREPQIENRAPAATLVRRAGGATPENARCEGPKTVPVPS